MKMDFEDDLINSKILFFKVEKSQNFLFSKFFHSMKVYGKKITKNIMLGAEVRNVIITSYIKCFANVRKYFERIFQRLTFKYFEKVAQFSKSSSFRG